MGLLCAPVGGLVELQISLTAIGDGYGAFVVAAPLAAFLSGSLFWWLIVVRPSRQYRVLPAAPRARSLLSSATSFAGTCYLSRLSFGARSQGMAICRAEPWSTPSMPSRRQAFTAPLAFSSSVGSPFPPGLSSAFCWLFSNAAADCLTQRSRGRCAIKPRRAHELG